MKRTKLINTAQHPEQPLWDDNSERDNQTQMDSQDSIGPIRNRSSATKAASSGAACRVLLRSHIRHQTCNRNNMGNVFTSHT